MSFFEPVKGHGGCLSGIAAACRFTLLIVALLLALPAQATIGYALSVAQPEQHFFHVTMTIPEVRNEVIVQLPAWNARYQIRDFAYHVVNVRAADEASRSLAVVKLDKQTWRIAGQGTITVQYATYWDEPGPFSSQLNGAHAFLNLATILFYVPDRRSEDARIVFDDLPRSWRVAVALRSVEDAASRRRAAYVAPNYDALVDAPVELGAFDEFRLEGAGPPVRVVVHGDGWNREQLAETLRRIVSYEIQLMGAAPFEEYLFIYHIGSAAGGAGGMEHANSTAIFTDSIPYLADVTAHEFFHLWNVKRIRPQSLEPVDYTREQWTRALWFAEGVTDTYRSYTLVRTGLLSRKQFYEHLASLISELESRPAHRWKSAEEASLDAWFEKYPLYLRPDFSISYYNKGELLGVLLDVLIRDATDNRASLDDLMRFLNDNFAPRGRFYRDSIDIRAAAEAVIRRANSPRTLSAAVAAAAGMQGTTDGSAILTEFFSRYVAGTDELPCADFLARAGLVLKGRGGARADFGFWAVRDPDGMSVATQIEAGSAAQRAGVREGDVLVALNGASFPRNPLGWLRDHRPGETVRLRLLRNTEKREVFFALGEEQERAYEIEEAGHATEKQRRIRQGLLHGTTDPVHP
jgi:predicted metalloprotease with PDZ domain